MRVPYFLLFVIKFGHRRAAHVKGSNELLCLSNVSVTIFSRESKVTVKCQYPSQ